MGLRFRNPGLIHWEKRDGGRCSKQLRLVEVDPEEHCRAQGDDENSPAELQQCIARVASMRNLWDGQHCSRDSCCLGCSVLWCSQRSLTAKGGFWGRDECHAGKTKKGQAHSHHQERGRATSHGEQGATELQSLSKNAQLEPTAWECAAFACSVSTNGKADHNNCIIRLVKRTRKSQASNRFLSPSPLSTISQLQDKNH